MDSESTQYPEDIELMKYMLEGAEIPYEEISCPTGVFLVIEDGDLRIFFNDEGKLEEFGYD